MSFISRVLKSQELLMEQRSARSFTRAFPNRQMKMIAIRVDGRNYRVVIDDTLMATHGFGKDFPGGICFTPDDNIVTIGLNSAACESGFVNAIVCHEIGHYVNGDTARLHAHPFARGGVLRRSLKCEIAADHYAVRCGYRNELIDFLRSIRGKLKELAFTNDAIREINIRLAMLK